MVSSGRWGAISPSVRSSSPRKVKSRQGARLLTREGHRILKHRPGMILQWQASGSGLDTSSQGDAPLPHQSRQPPTVKRRRTSLAGPTPPAGPSSAGPS